MESCGQLLLDLDYCVLRPHFDLSVAFRHTKSFINHGSPPDSCSCPRDQSIPCRFQSTEKLGMKGIIRGTIQSLKLAVKILIYDFYNLMAELAG